MSAATCLFVFLFTFTVCASKFTETEYNETANYPCKLTNSVVISEGDILENKSIVYDGIMYDSDTYFSVNINGSEEIRGCPCLMRTCVMKCCPVGEMGLKNCTETDHPFEVPIYVGTNSLVDYEIYALPVRLTCLKFRERKFYMQTNGSLLTIEAKVPTIYTPDEYCVDFVELPDEEKGTKYRLDALLCFPEQVQNEEQASKINIVSKAMLISVPFLVVTLVVYAILPELHNLHGYIMITYLACLIVFFTFLSAIQISTAESKVTLPMCLFMDFAVYFSSMASFFWMNVMCFDIWWTFSGQRSWQGIGQASVKKRYMLYSIYAWLIPTLLTCILAYMQFNFNDSDNHIYPGFGLKNCWFYEKQSQLVYMYVPIGILLACNMVLFSATTYRIFSISRETQMLQENQSKKRTFEKERQRFFLYIKLFTVMGLNWILEIVSFIVETENKGWIVSDVFNTLIGVFIFIIFVLKKKILKLIIKRYMPCLGEKVMKRVETSTTLPSLDNSIAMNSTNLQKSSSNSTANSEAKNDVL